MCQWAGAVAAAAVLIDGGTANGDSDVDGMLASMVDDGVKPGGGSTPSSISSARCKRAFLSQSSMG